MKNISNMVRYYEDICPCLDFEKLLSEISKNKNIIPEWLTDLANKDLSFRDNIIKQEKLSMSMELFLFGRPIFQIIQPMGILTREINGQLELFLGNM